MNDQKTTFPRFLSNEPCGQDLFEGQSHDRIAQSIVNLLETNDHNQVIGIEGGWGSGKSNMIEMIRNKLNPDTYYLFLYDAWAYQTDSLRRSIVQSLTSFLVDGEEGGNNGKRDGLLKENIKWKNILEGLLSKRQRIKSKTIRDYKAITIVGSTLAILSPILIYLGGLIRHPFNLIYWLGVFSAALIGAYYMQWRNMKVYGQTTEFKNVIKELLITFIDKRKKNEDKHIESFKKHETIYEEKPTSRDFRNWISTIDHDIKGYQLVIVFDNIDRLTTEKVQEFWSAIHTLFAGKNYSNIHLIVPFNRDRIKYAFKNEDFPTVDSDNESAHNSYARSFGDDFINKTFDVVYRIAPLIMSDWRGYFDLKWKEAFGTELDKNSKVEHIFDELSDSATPREIIAFINEFVAIKQTVDDIPDDYIAIYIFGKDQIAKAPLNEIIEPTFLRRLNSYFKNDLNMPKYLSALFYQLPIDTALDVIYLKRLFDALNEGNVQEVCSISQLSSFDGWLEKVISRESIDITNAIKCLDSCSSINEKHWKNICDLIIAGRHDGELKNCHVRLLEHISEKKKRAKYFESFIDIMPPQSKNRLSLDSISTDNLNATCTSLPPDLYILYVTHTQQSFISGAIKCDSSKLDKYLSELDLDELKNLEVIPIVKREIDFCWFESYIQHLEDLIDENENINDISIIYTRLKEVKRFELKRLRAEILDRLLNETDGTIPFFYDLLCMKFANALEVHIASSNINENTEFQFLNRTDDKFVDKIVAVIQYYVNYDDMLLNDSASFQLLDKVRDEITVRRNWYIPNFKLINILTNYERIKRKLSVPINDLIFKLNQVSTHNLNQISIKNIKNIPLAFFEDTKSIHNKLIYHSKAMYIKFILNIPMADLNGILSNKDTIEYKIIRIIFESRGEKLAEGTDELYDQLRRCLNDISPEEEM